MLILVTSVIIAKICNLVHAKILWLFYNLLVILGMAQKFAKIKSERLKIAKFSGPN